MSMKVEEKPLPFLNMVTGAKKDSFGLAVIDSQNKSPHTEEKKASEKQRQQNPQQTGLRAVYHNGVRVPILQDIDNKYKRDENQSSCRFDIVETVRTVIKPGTYTPAMAAPTHGHQIGALYHSRDSTRVNQQDFPTQHNAVLARDNTFNSSRTGYSEAKEKDLWEKLSSYNWNKPPQSADRKKKDARDVLYKHTYCPESLRLRYRSSTLPHIAQDRPWTVGEEMEDRHRMSNSGDLSPGRGGTITPKQPRGTVVRFSESMRPTTFSTKSSSLEVKRYSVNQQGQNYHQFANIRNVFPLIRQDSRRAKRVERPLKFENSRYNAISRSTLFKQHPMDVPPSAFNRDYKSADTFKEYLDSLQNNLNPGMHNIDQQQQQQQQPQQQQQQQQQQQHRRESRQSHLSSEHDYHNRALQSVQAVNKPEDNLKSPPASEAEVVPQQPDTRSAITIEIKSSWKESVDDQSSIVEPEKPKAPTQSVPLVAKLPLNERPKSETALSCPANTPTPVEEEQT